jgi:hypothetical protein
MSPFPATLAARLSQERGGCRSAAEAIETLAIGPPRLRLLRRRAGRLARRLWRRGAL